MSWASDTLRRFVVVIVAAAVLVGVESPTASAAGTSVPSAPNWLHAFPGVDGVALSWTAPTDAGGGINSYVVYRAAAGGVGAPVGSATQTSYFDAAPVGDWTYTVTAVNDAGESVASSPVTTTVDADVAAGTVDGFAVSSSAIGSVAFGAATDTVTMTSTASGLTMRGVSTASAPQGAKDLSVSVATMVNGKRLQAGVTYSTGFLAGYVSVNVGPHCNASMGPLSVQEASFRSDGTPLVFSAAFAIYCTGLGSVATVQGVLRWHAHDSLEAITTSSGPQEYGQVATNAQSAASTVTLYNAGSLAQPLGTAALAGANASWFVITADTCSGVTLQPGSTCTVGVAAAPKAAGNSDINRLVVPTSVPAGAVALNLRVSGVDKPPAPTVAAAAGYRSVTLTWQNQAGSTAKSHTIYRGSAPDALTVLAQLPAAMPSSARYVDSTGTPGVTYYYAVSDANIAGDSPLSAPVSAAALPDAVVHAGPNWTGFGQIWLREESGATRALTTDSGDHDTPAVSPDGTRIAYTSNHGNATNDYDLWVYDVPSATATRVTYDPGSSDGLPTWSPDGTRVAFARFPASGTAPSLWTAPASGGAASQVAGTSGYLDPAWSPNGRLLAATNANSLTPSIVVTSLDGTYRRTVAGTYGPGYGGADPSWSPDGSQLAFIRVTATVDQVALIPAAGGTATIRTPADVDVLSLDWSPNGSRIVFEGYSANNPATLWTVNPSDASTSPLSGSTGYVRISPSVAAARPAYVPTSASAAPSGLTATLGTSVARLTWFPQPGAAYYVVRRSAAGGPAPASPEDGVAIYSGTATSVSAAGLTTAATYRVSVFAVSPLGDASAAAQRSVQPAATPTIAPNGTILRNLYAGGPRFTASWGRPLPAGQVYDVQIGLRKLVNGAWSRQPVWSNLAVGTTATSKVVSPTAGNTYYLRVRVRDAAGNTTPWSAIAMAPVPYDDRAFAASGAWSSQTGQSGRYLRTVRASRVAGAKLTLTTYGTSFTLIADKCRSCGKVKIYVNGVLKAVADTYAPSTRALQAIWTSPTWTLAKRTITIVVAGTAGRPTVRIDGLSARR